VGGGLENLWKSDLVGVYGLDGQFIKSFGQYDPSIRESKKYLVFPVIDVNVEQQVLASIQMSGYRIQLYDLQTGERLGWFGTKPAHFTEPESPIRAHDSRQQIIEKSIGTSSAIGTFITSDYVLLNFENVTTSFFQTNDFNDKEPYIAVYDIETFDLVGEIRLPYILSHVANDRLYLRKDDNPDNYTISVYELSSEAL
ncbi:MAG: hypothetical protein ACNA78_01900, partial [Balneolaceae bacterium]